MPAIVLAAGASRRLGQQKQLIRIAGETLLERTLRVARGAGCEPVCVVLGAQAERILSETAFTNVDVVLNDNWELGMATSIHAGIRWLEEHVNDANEAMLLVCDQPRLTVDHLSALIGEYEKSAPALVASTYAGTRGVPAIFPRAEFAKLLVLRGDQGARRLLQRAGSHVIEVAFENGDTDIDTPDELEIYLAEMGDPNLARGRGRG